MTTGAVEIVGSFIYLVRFLVHMPTHYVRQLSLRYITYICNFLVLLHSLDAPMLGQVCYWCNEAIYIAMAVGAQLRELF